MWELGHVELPAVSIVDDLGATFLIQNPQVGKRTKHIDIRCRWMHDSWERLTLEAACVRGTENNADMLTKNAELKLFEPLEFETREGILACWRENDKLVAAPHARRATAIRHPARASSACFAHKFAFYILLSRNENE